MKVRNASRPNCDLSMWQIKSTASPARTSSADCIPFIIKACPDLFSEVIAELAHRSFRDRTFPFCFKHASVIPLLKKSSLDKHVPSSYRPISNLVFIKKILERLFLARIQPESDILSSPNLNQYESAYRCHHSTETSILHTLDNILCSSDSSKSTTVIFLDLSAAFDTIYHNILLSCLSTGFGISDRALFWLPTLAFLSSYWTSLLLCCHMCHWRSTGFRPGNTSVHGLYFSYCWHCQPSQNQSTDMRRWHPAVYFSISIQLYAWPQ